MKLTSLILLFIAGQVYGVDFKYYTEKVLNCKALNQGTTIAKSLDIMFLEKNHNNVKTIEYVAINHHESFLDSGGYADPTLGTYYGIRSQMTNNNDWEFNYEIEYFTNTITVLEDDHGYKLLTEYLSDGPVEYGFYECASSVERFKDGTGFSAWSRLEKALDSDVATEYEVEILSEAYCGEYDPYFLGDTCQYEAKVLDEKVTRENKETINIFFYDYDQDSLKIGEKVKVKAVTISDYEDFEKKKSFAVELQ